MKISEVKGFHFKMETGLKTIGANPVRIDSTPVVVVKISTDEGIEGYCANIYITSGKILANYVEEVLAPALIGQDPFQIGRLDEELAILTHKNRPGTSMIRANGIVNIALWDIMGKALNRPVAHLLGFYTDKVKAYASTAEWKEPEALAEDALRYAEMGFKAMKVRGGRPNREDDIRVVAAIRKAIGSRMELWVDANRSYTRERAFWQARAFAEYNIRSIEEPLNPEDIEGYADLCKKSPIPISAGENLMTLMQWRNMLQRGAIDIMQPWPTQCGGISGLRKLCGLAEAFNLEIEPHASLMIAESIQVMCTTPQCSYVMWSVAQTRVREALFEENLDPVDGYFWLPDKPGLGVTIKPKFLKNDL